MICCRFFGRAAALLAILLAGTPAHPSERGSAAQGDHRLWNFALALAADSMEGRGTGTPGGERAARYIASQLEEFGLEPLGEDGTWFQDVPLHGSVPLEVTRFHLNLPGAAVDLDLGRDYLLYTTGAKTLIPMPVPLVFVGYGIVAPEYDYNDYHNLDVEGSIVVFLTGEPASSEETYFDGPFETVHAYPEMKQRVALSRGALGSVLIPSEVDYPNRPWSEWSAMFLFEHVTLPYDVPRRLDMLINPEAAELLFRGSGYSLAEVFAMAADGEVRSFPLSAEASFQGRFQERDFVSPNVIGVLRGSDPLLWESYVILSAHYDHLGIGAPVEGDSIHNGFVDNALGCAAVLEIARTLSDQGAPPLRSIIFLFTTAEEVGLLGSRHYTANPRVPLHKTIANVNVQGLAILDTFDEIIGVGSEYSTIGEAVRSVAAGAGLRVGAIPPALRPHESFARSDQLAFALAGIPATLLVEGLKYRNHSSEEGLQAFIRWGEERYHTPFDDADQPVDRNAVAQHFDVVRSLVVELANTFRPPQWHRGVPYVNARLRSIAEER
jgi:hypothetical protein